MKKRIVSTILVLIFLFIAFFAGYQIYREYSEYHEGAEIYRELEEYVKLPEGSEQQNADDSEPFESDGEPDKIIDWPVVDFNALKDINPDCVAWIQIEGTEINYPVVQGEDNSYYLKHLFEGKWNSSGSIFLDSRVAADLSERHSIIYGHHMKNGTMFSDLTEYKKQEYYDAHPAGFLITPNANYQIVFFAGYVARANDAAWKTEYEFDEAFSEWLCDTIEKSCFDSDIYPTNSDRIITLSTCSYEFKNARFVLHGVLR